MALTNASLPAKRRILAVCVKLFLEQGYKKTTVAQIVQGAGVSNSSFQNIFRAKDGVLCRFWVLAGCTPEERREPSGQRCAYACRCPEASRPRWAA